MTILPVLNQRVPFSVDELTFDAFTYGDCWALAIEVNKITGWQIVAIGCDEQSRYPENRRDWCHMANRTPEGKIIDITGISTPEETLEEWAPSLMCSCEDDGECACLIDVKNVDHYIYDQVRQYSEDAVESAKSLVDFYRSLFPAQNAAQIAA